MNEQLIDMFDKDYLHLCKKVSNRVGGIINAEDVVQESFARALKYKTSFNPAFSTLGAWFNTILNNASKDFKREERMQGMAVPYETISDELDEIMFRDQMVHKVISDMEVSPYSEILRLYFILGFTRREVAQVIDQKPQSIANAVQRFKQQMRGKYEDMCS
jgi:RNA polymerase sigma factor (sigma-70 family)